MIYILEDDNSIRELITYTLNNQGFKAEGFSKPSEFWHAISEKTPKLLLLDIMLPEEDGLQILKRLRNSTSTKHLPIIMLTAKGSEFDRVVGLDSGADDYICKPFGMMELIARIKALLRRTDAGSVPEKSYTINGLYVNPSKHIIKVNGEEIVLTYKEFELLCLLLENEGTVFTRTQLLDKIWGYGFYGESRTVDVHIRTLRQKLGDCGALIETVRGIGYKIGSGEYEIV